jgi:hypothetical protein
MDNQRTVDFFPAGVIYLSLLRNVHNNSGNESTPYSRVKDVLSQICSGWSLNLTTHSQTQARLRMKRATHLPLQILAPSFYKIVSLYARVYVTERSSDGDVAVVTA